MPKSVLVVTFGFNHQHEGVHIYSVSEYESVAELEAFIEKAKVQFKETFPEFDLIAQDVLVANGEIPVMSKWEPKQ